MKPEVLIYTTSWCPFCRRAKALLKEKGVAFTELDIEADPAHRKAMIETSGRSSRRRTCWRSCAPIIFTWSSRCAAQRTSPTRLRTTRPPALSIPGPTRRNAVRGSFSKSADKPAAQLIGSFHGV